MLKKRRRKRKRKTNKQKQTKLCKLQRKYGYKIDNKYQKAKIKNLEQSSEFQKYNVKEKKKKKEREKEKKNKITKIIKNIYMKFALKNRVFFFFCKVIVGYKSEN